MAARHNRRRRRRGRFSFLYKLLSVVLIVCAIVAGSVIFFRVEEITVSGSTVYSSDEIIAASEVAVGDNLFLVGRPSTSKKILEQLPYIREVNVRAVLPSTLAITVSECTVAGVVEGEDGSFWVLDTTGKLLEQGSSALKEQYPLISGIAPILPEIGMPIAVAVEQLSRLDSLKGLLAALEERGMLGEMDDIDLSGPADILMGFQGRFTVEIPLYDTDFSSSMNWLQAAAEYLGENQTGTIDLTLQPPRFIPN